MTLRMKFSIGFSFSSTVKHCSFLPNDSYLLTSSRHGDLYLWDVTSIKGASLVKKFELGMDTILIICTDATVIFDQNRKTLVQMELDEGKETNVFKHDTPITCAAISPNSKLLSCSATGEITMWCVETTTILFTKRIDAQYITCCNFSETGQYIVIGTMGYEISIWDAKTGVLVQTTEGHDGEVRSCFMEKNLIISAGRDLKIKFWDFRTGNLWENEKNIEENDITLAKNSCTCI